MVFPKGFNIRIFFALILTVTLKYKAHLKRDGIRGIISGKFRCKSFNMEHFIKATFKYH